MIVTKYHFMNDTISSEREPVLIFVIFHIRHDFFLTSYFSSEKYPDVGKIVSHILKSLNLSKTCQNC